MEAQDVSILENKLKDAELPNIYERTKMTINFNKELEIAISKLNNPNIKYLDITTFTYDIELKRIKDEFFTRYDHHNFKRNIHFTKIINDSLKLEF